MTDERINPAPVFRKLDNGDEALVRYNPLPQYGNEIYQEQVVISRDEFIKAFNRWVR